MRKAVQLAAVAALIMSGCKSVESNMVDNGEPLESRSHLGHVNAHMTDNLEWIEAHNVYVWDGFYQGDDEIKDELDYYHVAGDKKSEQKVSEWRKQENFSLVAAWTADGIGFAALATGIGLMSYRTGFDINKIDTESKDPLTQVGLGVAIAGGVIFGASFLLSSFLGPDHGLNEWELVLDPEKYGEAAAEKHNARKSAAPADAGGSAEPAPADDASP